MSGSGSSIENLNEDLKILFKIPKKIENKPETMLTMTSTLTPDEDNKKWDIVLTPAAGYAVFASKNRFMFDVIFLGKQICTRISFPHDCRLQYSSW